MAAAEETAEKPAAPAPAEAPAGGASKMVLILTLVNMLATLGMVGVLFISFRKDAAKPTVGDISAHEEHAAEGGGEGHGGGHGAGHGSGSGEKADAKKPVRDFGKIVTLEQFTVNLSTSGTVNPKFARVAISLEVPSEDTEGEVNQRMAQVRNTIIDLFNSKKPSDLSTTDGRNFLKDEIKNALNSFLVSGKVKGVFFTNFALSG